MLPQQQSYRGYFVATIISIIFAVVGFSYNAWRLERSEANTTIRTASFEVLTQLAELEQTLYIAYYDEDLTQGSPRKSWVQVGLIKDLSVLISPDVATESEALAVFWSANWQQAATEQQTIDQLIVHIDRVRLEIKSTIQTLD